MGLKNFGDVLADGGLLVLVQVGLIWAVSVTLLQFVAALGLALLLNSDLRFRGFARALAMAPWAMPPVVIGLMWRLVYHPNAGILNATLRDAHVIGHNIDWLNDFCLALPAIIVVGRLDRDAADHRRAAGRACRAWPGSCTRPRPWTARACGGASGASRCRSSAR